MLYSLCRRVLFSMQPETAHNVTMANLDWATHLGLHKLLTHMPDEDPVEVMGLRFPNTIGLAAGMDKDGIRVNAFGALGFGHVEIGTITPLAQPGNPKPRCFRVIPAKGIINRMGFIASGGVMTPQDAVEKMEAGAKLLQLYTGFIYSGPALIAECSEAVARWRAAQKA